MLWLGKDAWATECPSLNLHRLNKGGTRKYYLDGKFHKVLRSTRIREPALSSLNKTRWSFFGSALFHLRPCVALYVCVHHSALCKTALIILWEIYGLVNLKLLRNIWYNIKIARPNLCVQIARHFVDSQLYFFSNKDLLWPVRHYVEDLRKACYNGIFFL